MFLGAVCKVGFYNINRTSDILIAQNNADIENVLEMAGILNDQT